MTKRSKSKDKSTPRGGEAEDAATGDRPDETRDTEPANSGEPDADREAVSSGSEGEEPLLRVKSAHEMALEENLEAAHDEIEELKDQWLRSRAEFDNYRRRTAREFEDLRKRAAETLILDLLPVVDNLERALAHQAPKGDGFVTGVQLVAKQLGDVLVQHGISPIPALGEPFNPEVHEAIARIESDTIPADVVAEEYVRGYWLGDRVLRPSKVVVSSGPPASESDASGSGE